MDQDIVSWIADNRPDFAPLVSVVVAVRGNTGALAGLFSAVAGQEFKGGVELIVVDNHRVPVLPLGLHRADPMDYRVVHEPHVGLSRARNTGIRQAAGDFILITDADARPAPPWVSQMVDALLDTDAHCAGGRVVPYFTGPSGELSAEELRLFVPPSWPTVTSDLVAPYWVVGCNLGFRREPDGPEPWFHPRFGVSGKRHLSCEELELTVRAQREGRRVVVVPDAVVQRAIHPKDLKAKVFVSRALWHGVSIARLLAVHPYAAVYDSFRIRDAVAPLRWGTAAGRRAAVADLARVVGLRAEQLRLGLIGFRRSTKTQAEQSTGMGEYGHG